MNGDWVTYLLILIFFVFPLIQQILETARKGRTPPPPPSAEPLPEEWTPTRLPAPAQPRRKKVTATVETSGTWSDGWGSWPGEMPRPETAQLELPERVVAGAERELPGWTRDLPEAEPAAEAEPAWVTTVETPEIPAEVDKPTRRPFPIAIPIVRGDRPARPKPYSSFPMRMRSPDRLRDAIILTEVLGPPKSLRSDDPMGG